MCLGKCWASGGGVVVVVAFHSVLNIIKGTGNVLPFQNSDLIYFGKTRGMGRGIHPPITLNLKKGTGTSYYQSIEPSQKFILSPFLHIPNMHPGHNLHPLT